MRFRIPFLKYVCCYSGGKDSTSTILLAHEKKEPLDCIVFSEVMFDKTSGISGENPVHMRFIKEVAKPFFEKLGYEFVILHAEMDFLDCFNRRIEKPRKHMHHKGLKFGFPCAGRCHVKRDCKIKPIQQYLKSFNEPVVQYLGIAADEPKRLKAVHKDPLKISLLEKYGYTEEMALKKCLEYGLYSPGYDYSKRSGCWFCEYSKLPEQKLIKEIYPEVWDYFVALEENTDDVAYKQWNVRGTSLRECDRILEEML